MNNSRRSSSAARASRLGMPSFKDLLSAEQVREIQAYILSRAKAEPVR
jgi:mono/diheme cytochrome c family protein